MAFTSTITGWISLGNRRASYGTFTTDTTGGDIDTGLTVCDFIFLQHSGASAIADRPVVNETLPIAGSAVTIVNTSGKDGYWWAFGK